MTIETQRTRLRRFGLSDVENMRELESDPEVMKFTPSRVPQSLEQTKSRLQSLVEKEATYAPFGVWAVELKDTSDFVGWFMLIHTQFNFPELGFMLVRRHWGKGLATEVASALIDFGYRKLNLPGIAATTNPENSASIRVLEKLGFGITKTISTYDRIFERDIELCIFELLNKTSSKG